jgi:hypothetical protein
MAFKLTKQNIISISVGIISFCVTFFAVQYFMGASKIEKQLKQASEHLNTQLPMQTDTFSRLDSTAAVEDHTFCYYYTLLEIEKANVNMDTVNKYVRPELLKNARTNPDLQGFREHGITLDYVYYDKNGVYVTTITASKEDYNNF